MRWLASIIATVLLAAFAVAGFIVASNRGIDLRVPNWSVQSQSAASPELLTACEKSPRFPLAYQQLARARKLMSSSHFEDANRALDLGIKYLGSLYEPSYLIFDDSGMDLDVADVLEHQGKIEDAARERCSILHDKLETCGDVLVGDRIVHLGPLPSDC